MSGYLGACGAVFLAIILVANLSGHRKDMASLLTLAVCIMLALTAAQYIRPVLDFVRELEEVGSIDREMVQVLIKIVGIGIISEITMLVCADAGNGAMGKSLQFLSSVVILSLSVPLFRSLIGILQEILGQI